MINNILIYLSLGLNIVIIVILILKSEDKGLAKVNNRLSALDKSSERLERIIREEMSSNREEFNSGNRKGRMEMTDNLTKISLLQKNQLDTFSNELSKLTTLNEQKLDKMRETIEERLKAIQEDNNIKLEKMRQTVDEKLEKTLEYRLGESFKLVSDRLEMVHKGLGEMQSLANGVGDLKKVLTNVKTRGTWGEIQLGNLLEQILVKEQYETNVVTKKGSNERVEFAIKLPGHEDKEGVVYIPIDSKFPIEDYQRLISAQEDGNLQLIEETSKQLDIRIKAEAKDIKEKYIDPPNTTDFGILFLPIEGLYAEVLRRTGLCEFLQREYRVIITGPTTLTALLNSLQMGFRTIAIEKRSSEVWQLLGTVKTEFTKFGDILEKTQKKLQEASNTIDFAAKKSRNIERKLSKVQVLKSEDDLGILNEENEEI
ncbi:MAG: DNA recombination protein RmuC [Clostridiaceae bacterium]|nr:DNA recombination protein RmuC [Clostridiaceae bacterium]